MGSPARFVSRTRAHRTETLSVEAAYDVPESPLSAGRTSVGSNSRPSHCWNDGEEKDRERHMTTTSSGSFDAPVKVWRTYQRVEQTLRRLKGRRKQLVKSSPAQLATASGQAP